MKPGQYKRFEDFPGMWLETAGKWSVHFRKQGAHGFTFETGSQNAKKKGNWSELSACHGENGKQILLKICIVKI